MVLKFVNILTDFFPKGKAWDENQENITKLKEGLSDEFGRIYDNINSFYENFNIINKFELAKFHGRDYDLDVILLDNTELQHIIVNYIYGNYTLEELIEDFASFIGASITIIKPSPLIEFAFEFPAEFGDENVGPNMQLFIEFAEGSTCIEFRKIKYIVNFFKPPYLQVDFTNPPASGVKPFTLGDSQFGEGFGEEVPCT